MESKYDKPAFPTTPETINDHEGMTLLDYFAAKAMGELVDENGLLAYIQIAEQAYGHAAAMM